MNEYELAAAELESRYRLIAELQGGTRPTERMVWWRILQYLRLFHERPLLRLLGEELDDRLRGRSVAIDFADASTREECIRLRRAAQKAIETRFAERPAQRSGLLELLGSDDADPWGVVQVVNAWDRLYAGEGTAFWQATGGGLQRSQATGEELRAAEALRDVVEPWRLWQRVRRLVSAPEHVFDREDVDTGGWLATQGVMYKLGIPGGSHRDTAALVLPDVGDLLFELPLFHSWVLTAVHGRRIRGQVLSRYKEAIEFYRAPWAKAVIDKRAVRTNRDEHLLRKDLGLFLLYQGFRVHMEPEFGNSRPDVVVDHEGAADFAIEIKVIRASDSPSEALSRLRTGMEQAIHYTRAAQLREGFLLVFWRADLRDAIEPTYHLPDCMVRVLVIPLRGSPSNPTRASARSVTIPNWASLFDEVP